jgi:hypothetical protein
MLSGNAIFLTKKMPKIYCGSTIKIGAADVRLPVYFCRSPTEGTRIRFGSTTFAFFGVGFSW